MSALTILIVAANSLNLGAALCLVRGFRATDAARVRRLYLWTRALAALLFALAVPIVALGVSQAHGQMDGVAPEHKARALASGISNAMMLGVLSGVCALPAIAFAVILARRSAASQRRDEPRR